MSQLLADLRADISAHYGPARSKPVRRGAAALSNPSIVAAQLFRITGRSRGALHRVLRLACMLMFSSDIGRGVQIAPGVNFPHPIGIVLGQGALIAQGCTIYHRVTLGADRRGQYPKVEQGCTIFTGATVFGGVTISQNTTLGAHVLINHDVQPNSTIRL